MTEDNEDYANILYLLHTKKFREFFPRSETEDITSFRQILTGICLGYPIENIKGFYVRQNARYGFFYCPALKVNITKDEKELFSNELKAFNESDEYRELIKKFNSDYSLTLELIEKIRIMREFVELVEENRVRTLKCEPDYKCHH